MPIQENKAVYRRYLTRCNVHHFGSLSEFVTEDVVVNGQPLGLANYQAGLARVITAFPDYHWELGSVDISA